MPAEGLLWSSDDNDENGDGLRLVCFSKNEDGQTDQRRMADAPALPTTSGEPFTILKLADRPISMKT